MHLADHVSRAVGYFNSIHPRPCAPPRPRAGPAREGRGQDGQRHLPTRVQRREAQRGQGPGRRPGAMDKKGNRLPMGVTIGDRVLIPQFGGSPVKAGEEEYHLFRDSEILAKINE
ncbi:hypothetical protein G7046_g3619 [Stylonectria norvegica]|nr:hypothetical protein G7046_g3619 [Stylonectria norvegica]